MDINDQGVDLLEAQKKLSRIVIGTEEETQGPENIEFFKKHNEILTEIINITIMKLTYQGDYTAEEKEVIYGNLKGFLDELKDNGVVTDDQILEMVDEDILKNIDYLDKSTYTKKKIRIKTKYYYEQVIYNLMQENNEGFAMLLTELITSSQKEGFVEKIINIMGYYALDPNRVCDVVIDVLSCKKDNQDILCLFLKQFNKENVRKILLKKIDNITDKTKGRLLVFAAAYLVKEGIVESESIWKALKPDREELIKNFTQKYDATYKLVQRNFVISILSTEKEIDDYEKEKVDLKALADAKIHKNQKFFFLEALLNYKCKDEFLRYYDEIADLVYLPGKEYITSSILEYYRPIINQIHDKYKKTESPVYAKEELDQVLEFVGLIKNNISYSLSLFEQTIAVFTNVFKNSREDYLTRFEPLLIKHVIPSLFNISLNDKTVDHQNGVIFRLLSCYGILDRYKIYEQLLSSFIYTNPYALNYQTIEKTKKFLKTVCDGEEVEKSNSLIFSKNLKSHPFFVFNLTISNIRMFGDLVSPIVSSCDNLPAFTVDVCNFLLIRELSNYSSLESEGDSISSKFLNISKFVSAFSKKHYDSDLSALLFFIANKIASDDPNDVFYLILLKNLLSEFIGFKIIHELNERQVFGMIGGFELRTSLLNYDQSFEMSKTKCSALIRYLTSSQYNVTEERKAEFIFILFFQLCKKFVQLCYKTSGRSIKFANHLIDVCNDCKDLLVQFHKRDSVTKEIDMGFVEFILKNEMKLLPQDVFTTVRMVLKEEKIIQLFDEICLLVDKYLINIFGENEVYLQNVFEQSKSDVIETDTLKAICLFWLFENKSLTASSHKYDDQIANFKKKLDYNKSLKSGKSAENEADEMVQKKIKLLKEERKDYKESYKRFLSFYTEKFINIKFTMNISIKQKSVLMRLGTVQDSLYTANWVKLMLLRDDTFQYFKVSFELLREVFPLLSGTTVNETVNLSTFILSLLKQLQSYYKEDEGFEKEMNRISRKYESIRREDENQEEESDSAEKKLQNIKDLIMNQLNDFSKEIKEFFARNKINFCKNVINFLIHTISIFPLNYEQSANIIDMLDRNKNFISNYDDLKLRCKSYRQKLHKRQELFRSLGQEDEYLEKRKKESKKMVEEKDDSESEMDPELAAEIEQLKKEFMKKDEEETPKESNMEIENSEEKVEELKEDIKEEKKEEKKEEEKEEEEKEEKKKDEKRVKDRKAEKSIKEDEKEQKQHKKYKEDKKKDKKDRRDKEDRRSDKDVSKRRKEEKDSKRRNKDKAEQSNKDKETKKSQDKEESEFNEEQRLTPPHILNIGFAVETKQTKTEDTSKKHKEHKKPKKNDKDKKEKKKKDQKRSKSPKKSKDRRKKDKRDKPRKDSRSPSKTRKNNSKDHRGRT